MEACVYVCLAAHIIHGGSVIRELILSTSGSAAPTSVAKRGWSTVLRCAALAVVGYHCGGCSSMDGRLEGPSYGGLLSVSRTDGERTTRLMMTRLVLMDGGMDEWMYVVRVV